MELKLDEYSVILFIKVLLDAPKKFRYRLENDTALDICVSADREVVQKEIYEWLINERYF